MTKTEPPNQCVESFEKWYAENLRGRRTLARFIWEAAWKAAQPTPDRNTRPQASLEGLVEKLEHEYYRACPVGKPEVVISGNSPSGHYNEAITDCIAIVRAHEPAPKPELSPDNPCPPDKHKTLTMSSFCPDCGTPGFIRYLEINPKTATLQAESDNFASEPSADFETIIFNAITRWSDSPNTYLIFSKRKSLTRAILAAMEATAVAIPKNHFSDCISARRGNEGESEANASKGVTAGETATIAPMSAETDSQPLTASAPNDQELQMVLATITGQWKAILRVFNARGWRVMKSAPDSHVADKAVVKIPRYRGKDKLLQAAYGKPHGGGYFVDLEDIEIKEAGNE